MKKKIKISIDEDCFDFVKSATDNTSAFINALILGKMTQMVPPTTELVPPTKEPVEEDLVKEFDEVFDAKGED